ncbi:MAG: hypothetical protein ACPGR8_17580, partial [Limisphaerales bacterium]
MACFVPAFYVDLLSGKVSLQRTVRSINRRNGLEAKLPIIEHLYSLLSVPVCTHICLVRGRHYSSLRYQCTDLPWQNPLGEPLHARVCLLQPERAGKIVGMFLEGLEEHELRAMLS